MKESRKHGIYIHVANPDRHNQSKVEGVIREMWKKWFIVILRQMSRIDYGIMALSGWWRSFRGLLVQIFPYIISHPYKS